MSTNLLPETKPLRKRRSTAGLGDDTDNKRHRIEANTPSTPPKNTSSPPTSDATLTEGNSGTAQSQQVSVQNISVHIAEGEKPLSQELIFGCILDLILQLIDEPFLGPVVCFIAERSRNDRLLLFCSRAILKTMDLYKEEFTFTEDDIDKIAYLYQHYTGSQMPRTETIRSFITTKLSHYIDTWKEIQLGQRKEEYKSASGDHINEDWIDYLVSKLLRRLPGTLWNELNQEHWTEVAMAHSIMVGDCSWLDMKASYKIQIERMEHVPNEVEVLLVSVFHPCPGSTIFDINDELDIDSSYVKLERSKGNAFHGPLLLLPAPRFLHPSRNTSDSPLSADNGSALLYKEETQERILTLDNSESDGVVGKKDL